MELTPREVQVNRTLPAFIPASKAQPIPDNPSDDEIGILRLFPERIVPVNPGKSQSALSALKNIFSSKTPALINLDNRHVVSTLRALQTGTSPYDTTQLEAFIKAQPESRWAPAFKHELARRQFKQGWFAEAVTGWDKLWDELKDRRDPGAIEVANEVLSHLLDAYVGLGNADRLARLIGEQELRPGNPVIQAKVLRARQAVWLLKHKPAQNVMCGPVALYCILQNRQQPFTPIRLNDVTDDYIATGISLSQLQKYADAYKMDLVAGRRSARAPIPTPAVMHLSSGHFSALLDQTNGYYLLEDRPMQFKGWVSLEALDAQSSGYFLFPKGPLQTGWQPVSEQEASGIFGRDGAHGQQPLNQSITPCSTSCGGGGAGGGGGGDGGASDGGGGDGGSSCCSGGSFGAHGMPVYRFHPQVASLRVEDIPIGYRPPVGFAVFPGIAYNDLDDSKPVGVPTFSNVGRMWSVTWLAYVEVTWRTIIIAGQTVYIPDYPVKVHVPGGGMEVNVSSAPNDRSFAHVTINTDGVLCTRTLPDGTRQLFSSTGLLRPAFLTQIIDPHGNIISLNYDSSGRLVAVTDAIGQVTTLEHNWPGDIWKVTKITDPFGRFATFSYAGNSNELSSVTDVLGLTTSFRYDTNEFLTSMSTPYGTTTFTNNRAFPVASYDYSVTATDPQGNSEKVHYIEPMDIPPFGPPLPTSINVGGTNVPFIAEDARLQFRNSYYWNKKAMKEGPDDIKVARNYRWFTDSGYLITPILEAVKEPLEARVWFNYPGMVGGQPYASYPYYAGAGGQPERVLRILSDGTPQLVQTYYNPLGYVTNSIDPLGRSRSFIYSTNLIDLLEVRQQTGPSTSDSLASFSYNTQHLPLTVVDASGKTNSFTYNAHGQLLTFTDSLGETTTLSYSSDGFLLNIDGPLPGTNDSTYFTYDAFGRRRTVTGPDGYTLQFDYDPLDRVTVITYPDGTYRQFEYNKLDLASVRDRLGRRSLFSYNSLRQILEATDPLNRITRFGWCDCGSLSSITDPLGRMTSWQYDVQSRVVGKQYPDGSKVSYVYDSAIGQLRSTTDEKGQLRVYDYNVDGAVSQISYPNAEVATPVVRLFYDSSYNRVTAVQDGLGTKSRSYYPVGVSGALRVSTVSGPWPGSVTLFQYDALGRLIGRTIDGATQTYVFDGMGRITNIVNSLGAFSYSYDGATPRLLSAVYPGGRTTQYSYYGNLGDRRLQTITTRRGDESLISSFSYAYDPVGNITNWLQQTAASTVSWNLAYDDAQQLLTVQTSSGASSGVSFRYSYDGAGNRLTEEIDSVRRSFSHNALNQLVSSSDSGPNQTLYEWDAEERLTAVVQGSRRSEFSYDGSGRRSRIIEKQNGVMTSSISLLWCGNDLCEIRDGSGATTLRKLFPQGEVLVGPTGSTNYSYVKDHLGSVRQVLDASGTVVSQYDYDPWGTRVAVQEGVSATVGYAGYFIHRSSGLNLAVFRGLNAGLARWIGRDPLQESGGINLYAYVGNNPINRVDPLGLQWNCNYYQSTGLATCTGPDGGTVFNEVGYSGTADGGRNDPAMQDVQSVGPIPQGTWIVGPAHGSATDAGHTGPNTMDLTPADGGNPCAHNTRNCSSFRIHGDSPTHDASQGCVILSRNRTSIPPGSTFNVQGSPPDAGSSDAGR